MDYISGKGILVGTYNEIEISNGKHKNDVKKMKKALKLLEGTYDFKSFCNDSKERDNFVRTILKTDIKLKNNIIEISIIGNGFLKQMVRNIVGVLIAIGEGKKEVNDIIKILDKKTRSYNIKTAPSCGLYLYDVYYNK